MLLAFPASIVPALRAEIAGRALSGFAALVLAPWFAPALGALPVALALAAWRQDRRRAGSGAGLAWWAAAVAVVVLVVCLFGLSELMIPAGPVAVGP